MVQATDGGQEQRRARTAARAAVVLEANLARMDGFAVCRTLLPASAVPIILLTADGRVQDRIRGLELGADACLSAPVGRREVVVRVRALLRRRVLDGRSLSAARDQIVVGEMVLDRTARQVWRASQPLELRLKEFDLLQVLMTQAGQAIHRHDLLDRVWGEDWIGDPRTLDMHVRWLRKKVEADPSAPRYIRTVHGYGFVESGMPAAA